MAIQNHKVSVVIPAYRVSQQILSVVSSIGSEVAQIIVVDDCCPEKSGDLVKNNSSDGRVKVVFHEKNLGVGAAMITGYQIAIASGAEIIVKVDGDGQMNGSLIASLLDPILKGRADYAKGNRFFDIEALKNMPKIRILGNLVLSFFAKISTGYWQIFDPNNGFTAVHISALKRIPLYKVSKRYFFESDMLFRLSIIRAVVWDVPMDAKYGDEKSNLSGRVRVSERVYVFATVGAGVVFAFCPSPSATSAISAGASTASKRYSSKFLIFFITIIF